jgi:hypothetical protein
MSPTTLISMEMVTVLKKKEEKSKDNKGDNFSYTFFFFKDINLFLMSFKIQDVKNKIQLVDFLI